MNTITPHLIVATVFAVRDLRYIRPSATTRMAAPAAGAVTLVVVILIAVFLAAMVRAACGLAALLTQFLQLAAAVTSFLFAMAIVIVGAVVLLVHR